MQDSRECGRGRDRSPEGDHVIPLYNGECEDFVYCKSKKTNLCGEYRVNPHSTVMRKDGKPRFSIGGKLVHHFLSTSTFSKYTVVDYACVLKINPEVPLDIACLLGYGLATGIPLFSLMKSGIRGFLLYLELQLVTSHA